MKTSFIQSALLRIGNMKPVVVQKSVVSRPGEQDWGENSMRKPWRHAMFGELQALFCILNRGSSLRKILEARGIWRSASTIIQ